MLARAVSAQDGLPADACRQLEHGFRTARCHPQILAHVGSTICLPYWCILWWECSASSTPITGEREWKTAILRPALKSVAQ